MHATTTHTPTPLTGRVTVITPRGHAALALLRLKHQFEQLSADDLEYVGPLLADLIRTAARSATA